ncbi:Putative Haloacid dehalogenase-like hydrolase family protein [Penicillium brasilianum]|nr:Putative Haloacid dehalogenase-like hydrolase family protein [Penicillium brasilianum]
MTSRLVSLRTAKSAIMSAVAADCTHLRPRRFAPLDAGKPSDAPVLKGIVFDVDGTLCLPQHHMFSEMREALGIDKSVDILHHIRDLPTPEDRAAAVAKVQAVERRAMLEQQPQPGLSKLMDYLKSRGLRRALCTRNFEAPVQYLIQNHLPSHIFLPIITRDTPDLLPKPDPAGILHIAREWGLTNRAENLIMVGDSIDDMTSGHAAGAATVLLVNERNIHLREHAHTDLCINRLDELIDILEGGFLGREEDDVHKQN